VQKQTTLAARSDQSGTISAAPIPLQSSHRTPASALPLFIWSHSVADCQQRASAHPAARTNSLQAPCARWCCAVIYAATTAHRQLLSSSAVSAPHRSAEESSGGAVRVGAERPHQTATAASTATGAALVQRAHPRDDTCHTQHCRIECCGDTCQQSSDDTCHAEARATTTTTAAAAHQTCPTWRHVLSRANLPRAAVRGAE
jgi:hypothetical protein